MERKKSPPIMFSAPSGIQPPAPDKAVQTTVASSHMKTPPPSHPHAGHRERMRRRFVKVGLDGFADHEVLEMALFYAIPQKNTNEIAHRLLERFSTLDAVLDASPEALCAVTGVTPNAGIFFSFLRQFYRRVRTTNLPKGKQYQTVSDFGEFFLRFYEGITQETVQVLLLDGNRRKIDCFTLCAGSQHTVSVNLELLSELIFHFGASSFVLAHNHPNGDLRASEEDYTVTREIYQTFEKLRRPLLEHILIAKDRYLPLLAESLYDFDLPNDAF